MRCASVNRALRPTLRSVFSKPMLPHAPLQRFSISAPGVRSRRDYEMMLTRQAQQSIPVVAEDQRFPKKKVAMLVAYIGTRFSGLQRNPGIHAVEDTLETAIFQAGGMLAANYGLDKLPNAGQVGWRRSGRTDKGVHSIGNIIAMKMQLRPGEPLEAMRQRINSFLPDDVRVLGVERTTRGFTPRRPSKREYHYMLPTEALMHNSNLKPAECYTRLGEFLPLFQGTHNYHNYTNRRIPSDPSCRRYILRASVDPELNSFYRVRIVGQSFMNHQIRKMIGAVVAAIRQDAPLSVLHASFGVPMQWLPTAPAGFLIKMKSDYSMYNKKWAGTHNGLYVRASLDFPAAAAESRAFEEKLLNHIGELNSATHPFIEWLDTELQTPVLFDKILAGIPTRSSKAQAESEEEGEADEDADNEGEEEDDEPEPHKTEPK